MSGQFRRDELLVLRSFEEGTPRRRLEESVPRPPFARETLYFSNLATELVFMNSSTQEKLDAGILYLYSTFSKEDFYTYLQSFFAEIFTDANFSILIPAGQLNAFYLEYSTQFGPAGLQRPRVVSAELMQILQDGQDWDAESQRKLEMNASESAFPVAFVKVLSTGEDVLGLLVFHGKLVAADDEGFQGLEDYIFDHVITAFRLVHETQ